MTIKELYEYAVEKGIENYEINLDNKTIECNYKYDYEWIFLKNIEREVNL